MQLTKAELDDYCKARLNDKRYQHTLRVVEWAKELAALHGCDVDKAELAAYLHDIAKHNSDKTNIEILKAHGRLEPYFEQNPQVAHGIVAALEVQAQLGITDKDVLAAIEYHSYGKAGGMSALEKIIFIADATEAGRNYKGLKKARKLAKCDLDAALHYIVGATIKDLINRSEMIYNQTIALWNELQKR